MRIGFIGAQSVGKTTLANLLAEETGFTLIREQIRISVKAFNALGFSTPDELANSTWYPHMMLEVYRRQLRCELQSHAGFVSDRTTLDYFGYYELLNSDEDFLVNLFRKSFIDHYRANYDLVIYIPIMFPAVDDNYRNINEDFRKKVDSKLRSLMGENKNVHVLKSLDLMERLKEVVQLCKF